MGGEHKASQDLSHSSFSQLLAERRPDWRVGERQGRGAGAPRGDRVVEDGQPGALQREEWTAPSSADPSAQKRMKSARGLSHQKGTGPLARALNGARARAHVKPELQSPGGQLRAPRQPGAAAGGTPLRASLSKAGRRRESAGLFPSLRNRPILWGGGGGALRYFVAMRFLFNSTHSATINTNKQNPNNICTLH